MSGPDDIAEDFEGSFETAAPAPQAPTPAPVEPDRLYHDAPSRARRAKPRGQEPAPRSFTGRTPPHSIEAEEYLLSCCFLDGAEVIKKCLDAKLRAQSFYLAPHQILYERMVELHDRKMLIDLAVVSESLKTAKQFDAVGGYPFLVQVSGRVPTTAQAGFFIQKVRELEILRDIIVRATNTVEKAYEFNGDLDEVVAPIAKLPESVSHACTPVQLIAKPLAAMNYPSKDPSVLIGTRHRYLCRSGALLVVAPSGVGKSTLSYQAAACWGVGRDFLGLDSIGPMVVLIIQGEDDDGDIGEVAESIRQGLKFTDTEMALFKKNVFVIRDKVNTGEAFISALRTYVAEIQPDIVMINPLMQYSPGLSKEEIAGPFLYGGLNSVGQTAKKPFAYVAFHHTPKPPVEDNKRQGPKSSVDRQYSAFGSSILTNFFRAIINVSSVKGKKGQFIFSFDKRGTRAGLYRAVEQGAGTRMEVVTDLRVQHSERKIKVDGHEHPMILWELSTDTGAEKPDDGSRRPEKPGGGRDKKFTNAEVIELFPLGMDNRRPIHEIMKKAFDTLDMKRTTFHDYRFNLVNDGMVMKSDDGKYFRPEVGSLKR